MCSGFILGTDTGLKKSALGEREGERGTELDCGSYPGHCLTRHNHCLAIDGVSAEGNILELLPPHIRTPAVIYVYRAALTYLPFFSIIKRQHMGGHHRPYLDSIETGELL